VGATFVGCSHGRASTSTADQNVDRARAAARQFLANYVAPDGRVVRHDQGDDTVSEGQSYALALAQVADDGTTFDRVWEWTAGHLSRPDGLLAAHADRNGTVDDHNAATDADIVTAWALLRATGANADAHHDDGRRLANAVLEHETLTLADGSLVLAAGNWATGSPGTLNPSYWAMPVLTDLGRLTGDTRWNDLAATSTRLVAALTQNGTRLPPDWARADASVVTATPAPNGQAPDVRYSFDAQRVVVWFALGDHQTATPLASSWARLLADEPRDRSAALKPDGTVIDSSAHPTPLIAAAAAAAAAGRSDDRDRLLTAAETLSNAQPSYYGDAWVALGRALLTTDLLAR
jgi:endoglucanase